MSPDKLEGINLRLRDFAGGTGGIDDLLAGQRSAEINQRLSDLSKSPLSCSQFNQLLALAHQPELSVGAFEYYWLSTPTHCYDVAQLPYFHSSYAKTDRIISIDQLSWGLYRFYFDCLLFYGTIANGFRELRARRYEDLEGFFLSKRFPGDRMIHRGPALPLDQIPQDDRYLIAEQACKSFEPVGEDAGLRMVLKGAWEEHVRNGGGKILGKELLSSTFVTSGFGSKQGQFIFAADALLESVIESEEDLLRRYDDLKFTFSGARKAALKNTERYLSMANDLDVYVATSMRSRAQFRSMAKFCETIFSHPAVEHLNLRYFDPTMSAADGHEDKGLIECLMVKCAKVLIYTAGEKDSYGKDAEAAMALSLGKPVIFFCDEEDKRRFFSEVHPLSRLINFESGVAVGAMATTSTDDVAILLSRIFDNTMQYDLVQPRPGYFRLRERLTGSTVRLQTDDLFLRETFANCYHRRGL